MNRFALAMGVAGAIAAFGMSGAASAATVDKVIFQNGTGFCQGALPNFENNLRKRPTAIANEGTSMAFVSCSAPKIFNPAANDTEAAYNLVIYNRTGAPVSVSCSQINSFAGGSTDVTPKTMTVPANNRAFFTWVTADHAGTEYAFPNFSCGLPPGTEVGYIFYTRDDEIGT